MGRRRAVPNAALAELVREVVERGGEFELPVSGDSMRPTLVPGDLVRWRRVRPGEPRLGQIVLIATEGRAVAHRVVELAGPSVVTAGDADATSDPPVDRAKIVAVLQRRKRPLRQWLRLGLQAGRRLFKQA